MVAAAVRLASDWETTAFLADAHFERVVSLNHPDWVTIPTRPKPEFMEQYYAEVNQMRQEWDDKHPSPRAAWERPLGELF